MSDVRRPIKIISHRPTQTNTDDEEDNQFSPGDLPGEKLVMAYGQNNFTP